MSTKHANKRMSRGSSKAVALVLAVVISLGSIAGCPSPAQVVVYAIAYQAFSFVLEETGKFLVKAAEELRQAGIVALPFEGTPTDQPASGTLSLEPGKVKALPLPGESKPLTHQGIDGSATVAVYISGVGSTNPCEDGTYVGSYELTIVGGAVTIANPSLDLPPAALAEATTGVFSICLAVTSTVDVQLIIEELVVTFGPPVGANPPGEQPPSEQPPAEQPPSEQPPSEQPPSEQPPAGFKLATVAHSGTEELLVGPSDYIDSSVAFRLEHPFNLGGYALSGDGQKVWFWTYWHWSAGPDMPNDWARVYSMNIDGSNLQRSDISLDDAYGGWNSPFYGIATDYDGSDAIIELHVVYNPGTFSEYGASRFFHCTPGAPADMVYDTTDNPPTGSGGRGLRLNDNATKFFWINASNLWAVDLASPAAATQICTVDHLNFYGPWDPVTGGEFASFDIDAAGTTWMINIRFWDNDTQSSRWELASGVGELPDSTQGITLAREGLVAPYFCMTDDASMVAYHSQAGGNWCYVQGPGGTADLTADGPPHTKATYDVRLSDNGKIAWFWYEANGDLGPGGATVLYDLDTKTRRMAGTNYFYGSSTGHQLSDDGSVVAAVFHCCRSEPLNHVYVLRDGVGARAGFPAISEIAYRFDDDSDALIVRIKATGENGLDRLFTMTHINGISPAGFYAAEESPLHGENEHFAAVEGETDVYERVIYLNGKKELFNGSQYLRIVAADGKKSRVTYVDIAPQP